MPSQKQTCVYGRDFVLFPGGRTSYSQRSRRTKRDAIMLARNLKTGLKFTWFERHLARFFTWTPPCAHPQGFWSVGKPGFSLVTITKRLDCEPLTIKTARQ